MSDRQRVGVGHQRHAQTSIWLWSQLKLSTGVLFMSIQKVSKALQSSSIRRSNICFVHLFSSLLAYNLPETVREADISKLSFAVELARILWKGAKLPFSNATLDVVNSARLFGRAINHFHG